MRWPSDARLAVEVRGGVATLTGYCEQGWAYDQQVRLVHHGLFGEGDRQAAARSEFVVEIAQRTPAGLHIPVADAEDLQTTRQI